MCNTCIHKIVCSKHIACGEVKTCEHFKEGRRGEWLPRAPRNPDGNRYCPYCKIDISAIKALYYKFCPNCGADMRGKEDG